jgi:hypothetical protein
MARERKKFWQTSGRLLVCVLLLLWIFHSIFVNEAREQRGAAEFRKLPRIEQWRQGWSVGPGQLARKLAAVRPAYFAASVLVMGLTLVLGMARWRLALRVQALRLPWGRALEISLVAHFFNSFLLGSTGGDLMKAYYAARETHHKKTEAVLSVLVDRVVGLWAMLLFACLMMPFNRELLAAHGWLRTPALLILAMMLGGSAFLFIAFWGGVSKGWSGARGWLRRLPKGDWLERLLDSCRLYGHNTGYVPKALAISMLLNGVCVLQFVILARGMNLDIPAVALGFIVPTVICIAALPITPSGLGVRENLFVQMLATEMLHVPPTLALSLSLLAYAGSLFWSLVGGLVYLTLKRRHHLQEVESAAERQEWSAPAQPQD